MNKGLSVKHNVVYVSSLRYHRVTVKVNEEKETHLGESVTLSQQQECMMGILVRLSASECVSLGASSLADIEQWDSTEGLSA